MSRPRNSLMRALFASVASLLVFAAVAVAIERPEYVAQVEPICKTNKEASDRYLKGVKKLVKQDKLKEAGTAFKKAALALEKAHKSLSAVEKPAADSAKLTKWLSEIKAQVALMKTISAKFNQGNKSKATSLAVKLQNNANKANTLVIAFSFNYCKIDPSKYT
jgi:cobyrinic acid a,c-diamide synthase